MTTEADEPDWLKNYKPEMHPPSAIPGKKGFTPGLSGNPNGRPKGTRNKKTLALQEFEKEGSEIAKRVVEAALAGDMQAANIALQRISPPLKARCEKVQFALDPDGPLTTQAQQVIAAVADGKVDPDTAKILIDCIGALAGIKGTDELEARLNQLELQMTKRN